MCYGEISGIDRDYHDYPESTIAQKVIFESSLWILSIWAYFQLEMRNYLKTIWSNYSIPGGICDQLWIIEVFSSRKNSSVSHYAIFCVQNHRFLKLCLKLSQNYLKTISKLSKTISKLSQRSQEPTIPTLVAPTIHRGLWECSEMGKIRSVNVLDSKS